MTGLFLFPSYYGAASFSLLCCSTSVIAMMIKVHLRGKAWWESILHPLQDRKLWQYQSNKRCIVCSYKPYIAYILTLSENRCWNLGLVRILCGMILRMENKIQLNAGFFLLKLRIDTSLKLLYAHFGLITLQTRIDGGIWVFSPDANSCNIIQSTCTDYVVGWWIKANKEPL